MASAVPKLMPTDAELFFMADPFLNGCQRSLYDVKFSEDEFSRKMDIKRFTNSDDVYIQPYQLSGLQYDAFVVGLKTNRAVALRLQMASDALWVTFTLKGSASAIDSLGRAKVAYE